MKPSSARMAASRGKALKLVLAARNRISAVAAAKAGTNSEPAPNTEVATSATTDGPPGCVGSTSYARATTVIPTNRIPSRIAITVRVLAAFLASGGLNAGTPLAMASTPVSATEPPANARSRRNTLRVSMAGGLNTSVCSIGTTVPVTIWKAPTPTISRARNTNR